MNVMRTSAILAMLCASLGLYAQETPSERQAKAIAVLKSTADAQQKTDACRELALVGTAEAVPALAGLLNDEKLSHVARYGLEQVGGPAADEALRTSLGNVKGIQLAGVIDSLGVRRDAKAAGALTGLLKDADAAVVQAAARALGLIGNEEAAQGLSAALAGAQGATQMAVCEGLFRCAEALAANGQADKAIPIYDAVRSQPKIPHQVRTGAWRGAILTRKTGGLPLLMEAARSADQGLAMAAARIAFEADAGVVKLLAEELGAMTPDRQVLFAGVLGQRRDAAALPALLSLAKAGDKTARVAAIKAAGEIGGAGAAPLLIELLKDPEAAVAQAAGAGLAGLRDAEADAAIATLLTSPDAKTRGFAIELLGQRRNAGSAAALLKTAADPDEQVRLASLKALAGLATAADLPALLTLLVKAPAPQEAQAAEGAASAVCARQSDREACAATVIAALSDAPPAAKLALLRVLRAAAGAKALAAVRAAAAGADAAVKAEALRVLCDWPNPDAMPDLVQLAKTAADAKLKILALRGCFRLIPLQDAAPEKKLAAVKDVMALVERVEERKLALAALADIPLAEAGRMIAQSLGDAAVKAEAEIALLKSCQAIAGSNPDEARPLLEALVAATANADVKKQAQALLRRLGKTAGLVIPWGVAGPYTQEGKDGFALRDIAFPPEQPDAKDVRFRALPPGADRNGAIFFDLAAACGVGEGKAAYVRTWIHADKEQPARFEFGTDDCDKLWFNGQQVHADAKGGAATPDKFTVDVTLKQGFNAVFMKVTQVSGPWEFCFRICKPDGTALNGLKAQATPPGEAAPEEPKDTKDAAAPKLVTDAEGWATLFNGKDLEGWDAAPGWWTIENGVLTSQSTPEKPCKQCNYIVWKGAQPGDFELLADFRLSAAANSGIQIRSERRPNWDTYGYQADMTGDGKLIGFIYHHKRGLVAGRGEKVTITADGKREVAPLADDAELLKQYKKDDWNSYRIVCRGSEITVALNGTLMCQVTDNDAKTAAKSGIIALQMHPGPPMKVEFKNLRVRELKAGK
jgi:HEAT repeat protein